MLKEANGRSAPNWQDWLACNPVDEERVRHLKARLTGGRISYHKFVLTGRPDLAEGCNKRAMEALDELIEMGAL